MAHTAIKKKGNKGDLLFYSLLMIWPLLQFAVFYIYVNFNSILFAFSQYTENTRSVSFAYLFANIKEFISSVNTSGDHYLGAALGRSLLGWVITTGISLPLGLFFSYYIGKNMFGAGFFRVILFLPSVISILVLVYVYNIFVTDALPAIMKDFFSIKIDNPLDPTKQSAFNAILVFKIFIGFGTSVLMFSNTVSGMSPETIEAGRIDGASAIQEFWHIVLPSLYSTMTVFLITSVSNILLDQFDVFSFYGWYPGNKVVTIGYLFFIKSTSADAETLYPAIAAFGVLLTLIAVPTTLIVKYLLEKFGPSEE